MYNASQLVQETKIQTSRTLLDARTTPRSILQERFRRHRVKSNYFSEVTHEKSSTFTRPLYNPEGSTDSYYDSYESSIESGQGDEFNSSTDSDYDSDSSDHGTISDSSEDDYANRTKRCITLLPLLLSPRRKSNRKLSSERDDRLSSYRNNMLESPRRKHNYRRKQHFKSDLRSSYKYSAPYLGDVDMYENSESEPDIQTQIISTKNGVNNNILKYFTPPHNSLASTYMTQYSGSNKLFQCIEKCKQRNLAKKIQGNEVQLQDRFGEKSSETKDVPYNMLQMESKPSQIDAEELRTKEIDCIMDQSSHNVQEKLSSKSLDTYSSKLNCSYLRSELISVHPQQDQENDTDEEYSEDRNWTLKNMNDKKYIADKSNEESEILTYPSDTEKIQISTKKCNNNCQTVTDTMKLNNMSKSDIFNHNVMAKQDSTPAEKTLMYDDPHITDVLSQNTEVHQEISQLSLENSDSSPHRSQDGYIGATADIKTNVTSYFYAEYPNTQETRQNNSVKEFEYHDSHNGDDHPDNIFSLQGDKGNCRGTESVDAHHTLDDKTTYKSQLSMGYTDTSHESQSTSYFSTWNDKQNNDVGNSKIQSCTEYFYTPDELTEDTEHYDDNLHDSNGYKTELLTRYNIPSKLQNPNGDERHISDVMIGKTQLLTGYTDESEDTRCNNKNCFDKIINESQLSMGYTDTSYESQSTSYFSRGNDKQNNDDGNSNIQSCTEYFYTPDELTEDTEHYDDNLHNSNGYKTELFTRYNVPSKFQTPNGVERHSSDVITGETQSLTGYTDASNESEDTRCINRNCFDSSDTDAESQLTDSSSDDNNEFQDLPEVNVGKQRETYNNGDNTNRGSLDSNDYQGINIETQSSTNYISVPDSDIQGFTNHLDLNGFSNTDEHSVGDIQGSNSSQYMNSQIQSSSEWSYTKTELHDASQHIITSYDPSYEVNQSSIEHSEIQNEYQNTGEDFTGNFYYSTNMNRETQLSNQNSNTSNDIKDTSENYFPDEYDFRNMKGEIHVPATSSEVLSELKETGQHFINHLKDPYISDNTSREISLSLEYSSNSTEFHDNNESSVNNKGSVYESQDTSGEILTSIKNSNFSKSEYHNNQKDSSDIENKLLTLSNESYKAENTKECFSSEDSQMVKNSNGEIQPISKYTDNVHEFQDNNEHTIEDERNPHVSGDITGNTQSTMDFSESSNGLLSTNKYSMVDEREPDKACDVREDTESSSKYLEVSSKFQDINEHFVGHQVFYDLNNMYRYEETQSSTESSDDSNELEDTVEDFDDDVGGTEVSTEYTLILYRFQDAGENFIVQNDLHDFEDINRQIKLSTEYPATQNEFQIYSEYEEDSQVDTNGNTEIFNYSDIQDEFLNKYYTGDNQNMYDYNTNYDTTLSSRHSNISCELEAAGENFIRNENSDTERTQPSGQQSDSDSEDNNEYELGDSNMSHIDPAIDSTEDAPFPHASVSNEEFSIHVLQLKSENISPQLQENNQFYEDCELSRGDFDRFEDETSTNLRYDSEYTEITSTCNKTHRTSSSDIQLQELHEDTVYLPFENKNGIELFTLSLIQNDDRRYNSDGPFTTQVESSESELSLEQSQNTDNSFSSWVTNLRYAKDKSNEMEYLEDDDFSSSDETEDFEYNKQEESKTGIPITHTYNNDQNKDGIQTIALSDASSAETIIETSEPEKHTPKVIQHHYYLMPVYIVTPHPSTQADTVISPFSDEEDILSNGGEQLTLTENQAEIEQILRSYSDHEEYSSITNTPRPVTSNMEDNTLLSDVVSIGPIMKFENNLLLSSNGQVTAGRNGYTNKINSFSDDLKKDSITDTQIPKSTSNQTFHDYLLGDQSSSSDTSQNMELIPQSDMVDSNYGENAAWKERNNQEKKQSLETDRQIESFYSGRSYNVLDAIYNAHPTLEPPYTSRPLEYLVSSQCFQPGCSTLFGEYVKKIVDEKIEEYHKQIDRKCNQCATSIQTKDNLFLDKIERASLTQGHDDNGVVLGKASVNDNGEACNSYIATKLDAVMNMLIGIKEWLMNSSVREQ